MADDLTKRGGRDRNRIDIGQDYELRDWSEKFGVTKEELIAAVQAFGTEATKVEQHLRERGNRKGPKRASERS